MPRELPTGITPTDLVWIETHDVAKITMLDGTVLNLGTAVVDVPDDATYGASIVKPGQVRQSLTRSADQVQFDVQNVDRQLGLTLNDTAKTLVGAKIEYSRVFKKLSSLQLDTTTLQNSVGLSYVGGILTKTASTGWGNGGASSVETIENVGDYVEFTANANTDNGIFGVSHDDPDQMYNTIEFGFQPYIDAGVKRTFIILDGYNFAGGPFHDFGAWDGDTVFKIALVDFEDSTVLRFYKNGVTVYTSMVTPNLPLRFDSAFIFNGSSISNIVIHRGGEANSFKKDPLLTGEISDVYVDQEVVRITAVGDLSSGAAYVGNKPIQVDCPLVFKGVACGYVGPLSTCNKKYQHEDGCSGRNNQHRYGGVIVKGELTQPIYSGDFDGDINDWRRRGGEFWPDPPYGRHRVPEQGPII